MPEVAIYDFGHSDDVGRDLVTVELATSRSALHECWPGLADSQDTGIKTTIFLAAARVGVAPECGFGPGDGRGGNASRFAVIHSILPRSVFATSICR